MLIYSNLTWKGFGIDRWLEQSGQMQSRAMLDQLCSMVHKRNASAYDCFVHTLDEFGDALKTEAGRGRNGKVILVSR